jgi:hypothetical protein
MPELNRLLVANPILSHIITLGSIITPTSPIHTTSVVIIVSTTPMAVIGGSKWLGLFCANFRGLRRRLRSRVLQYYIYEWLSSIRKLTVSIAPARRLPALYHVRFRACR